MVYSEPGVGTTFKIYLPVVEDMAASGEFRIEPEAPGGSETILLVDDEELIRDLGREDARTSRLHRHGSRNGRGGPGDLSEPGVGR